MCFKCFDTYCNESNFVKTVTCVRIKYSLKSGSNCLWKPNVFCCKNIFTCGNYTSFQFYNIFYNNFATLLSILLHTR